MSQQLPIKSNTDGKETLMYIITQNHLVEFSALAVSVLFFNVLKKGRIKTLPFFLAFIFLVELAGAYIRKILHLNNIWLYNISIPLEYSYYLFLFRLHGNRYLKSFIRAALPSLLLLAILYLMLAPIKLLHTPVLITGQVFVILSSCIYIYELFSGAEEESLFKNYFYWIVAGLFLFNLGDIIYFVFFPTINEKGWDKLDLIFESISKHLLLLLYLSYIVSILVFKKYHTPDDAGDY